MAHTFPTEAAEELVRRVLAGEAAAWPALLELLWPEWLSLARANRAVRCMPDVEEHVHEIAALAIEKLSHDDFHVLRQFPEWRRSNAGRTFADWFRIVSTNAMRDYVRRARGLRRTQRDGRPSVDGFLNEFAVTLPADEIGTRPPMTAAQTARQLLEFARVHLPSDHLVALEAWLQGATFTEMALDQACVAEEAERRVRAAVAVLRRRFAPAA